LRILALGLDQSNFLVQLYKGMKEIKNDFYIGILSVRNLDKKANDDFLNVFDKIYSKKKIPFLRYFEACFSVLISGWFWRFFIYILVIERKFKKAAHFIIVSIGEKALILQQDDFLQYEVFHFHYIQYSYLRMLWMLPKNRKIVCSFWGSDLLRTSDSFNHYIVREALQKADKITVQTIEMKEIVLSKYGRVLLDKIELAIFPTDLKILNIIDQTEQDKLIQLQLCDKLSINYNKIKVVIGHNANPFNNHIRIIEQLKNISNKQNLQLLIPFTYGISLGEKEKYKIEIIKALKDAGIAYVIIEEYMPIKELALLRSITDIMIHLPSSDALSAALTEAAYAGSIILTGGWLPYSPFKIAKLKMSFIYKFEELKDEMDEILVNFEQTKIDTKIINKNKVYENFKPEVTSRAWVDLFLKLAV